MINFFEQSDPRKLLDTLKTKIYGKQNDKKLDSIDSTLEKISDNILNKNTKNYGEIVQKLMSNSVTNDDIRDITSDLTTDVETQNRITRYLNAEEMCDSIPYCERALQVLVDGVISPDDITKKSLQVLDDGIAKTGDVASTQGTEIRNIIDKLKIEDLISDVIYGAMKLGDHFVEICDYTSKDTPLTQSMLNESETVDINDTTEYMDELLGEDDPILEIEDFAENYNTFTNDQNENIDLLEDNDVSNIGTFHRKLTVKITLTEDNTTQVKDGEENSADKTVNVENVRIIQHDPRCVIKLQSKRYKMCLGYLVLPSGSNTSSGNGSNANQYGISSTPMSFGGRYSGGLSSLYPGAKNVSGIDMVYQTLMTKIKKYISNSDISINKREVLIMLMRTIKELEDENADNTSSKSKDSVNLEIRFVPTMRMQHFKIPSQRFFPYGESIFYKSTFQGKLLIALETAVTMKRITDSIEKRVIYFETGLSRNGKNIVEELKTKFKKRKFSIDNAGTISTIPSQISSLEDIYIPQTKGRRFLEFDTLNSSASIRDATDELKYVRDTLVAGLQVPPAYINLEENLSNKAALAFENALFAQTIVSYQHTLAQDLQDMINKIFTFIKGERIKEGIIVTFSPPKMLQMERDVEKYDMANRIVTTLVEMGAPRKWAVKKYVDLDWDEAEGAEPDAKLTDIEKPSEDDGGMGGGFGGGMYGGNTFTPAPGGM